MMMHTVSTSQEHNHNNTNKTESNASVVYTTRDVDAGGTTLQLTLPEMIPHASNHFTITFNNVKSGLPMPDADFSILIMLKHSIESEHQTHQLSETTQRIYPESFNSKSGNYFFKTDFPSAGVYEFSIEIYKAAGYTSDVPIIIKQIVQVPHHQNNITQHEGGMTGMMTPIMIGGGVAMLVMMAFMMGIF